MKTAPLVRRSPLQSFVIIVLGAGFTACLLTLVIAAMHLPRLRESNASRFLLTLISSACPVEQVTLEEAENLRRQGIAHKRGFIKAPRRPAIGFVLDGTTREDAKRILAKRGVRCREETRGYELLSCEDVDPSSLGMKSGKRIRELVLAFGPGGRLIQVSLFRRQLTLSELAPILSETSNRLRSALGRPLARDGHRLNGSMETLENEMSAFTIEYRFNDYVATVTAAHLPTGLTIYEQYMSAAK